MARSTSKAKRAAPVKGRKIVPIMRAAQDLFLEHGYSVTSMDGIAERAGVSKATLYSYYKSKENLFAAIVTSFLHKASPEIIEEYADDEEILVTLGRMGQSVATLLLARDDVAAHRIVVAEAARSPALGELYFQVGPQRMLTHLSHRLKRAMDNGQLRRSNPLRAAEHFVGLVIGNLHLEALLCVHRTSSAQTRQAIIKSGVDVFHRAYAPEGGAG